MHCWLRQAAACCRRITSGSAVGSVQRWHRHGSPRRAAEEATDPRQPSPSGEAAGSSDFALLFWGFSSPLVLMALTSSACAAVLASRTAPAARNASRLPEGWGVLPRCRHSQCACPASAPSQPSRSWQSSRAAVGHKGRQAAPALQQVACCLPLPLGATDLQCHAHCGQCGGLPLCAIRGLCASAIRAPSLLRALFAFCKRLAGPTAASVRGQPHPADHSLSGRAWLARAWSVPTGVPVAGQGPMTRIDLALLRRVGLSCLCRSGDGPAAEGVPRAEGGA